MMNSHQIALRRVCSACQPRPQSPSYTDLSRLMSSLQLQSSREYHASHLRSGPATSKPSTPNRPPDGQPKAKQLSVLDRMKAARSRAQDKLAAQQKEMENNLVQGGLAPSSAFGGELKRRKTSLVEDPFEERNLDHMAQVLNPRPETRLKWQRKMVIRELRRRGRMNKTTRLARTEREHMSKSYFFKTSMKKLAPLARQIAGKSLDEAILQMRFSNKKAAIEVRQHLVQARNEAIVVKGMGLGRITSAEDPNAELQADPAETPALPHQTPLKRLKKDEAVDPTDMYIAQAWTNRGPYGREPEYRARGRMNILRPPYTGITVLLKEEKTRTREKAEKEARRLKKRLGKSKWTHLPDRPVTAQRQHVLW